MNANINDAFQKILEGEKPAEKPQNELGHFDPPAAPVYTDEPAAATYQSASVDQETSLAHSLISNKYYPVMIFGTRATGKTTFLTSMLGFFTSTPDIGVTITLGEPLIQSEFGVEAHESAERLFYSQVNDFVKGEAPALNQEAFPFFIPVELRKSASGTITRVALMESSGELWRVGGSRRRQPLRNEIIDVYRNFPTPISVLIIVPYSIGEDNNSDVERQEFVTSDESLLQTLQIYQKYRPHGMPDQFYFILTKWDLHTQAINSKEFLNPDKKMVMELVRERMPRSFNYYQNMAAENRTRVTPYSAGLMGELTDGKIKILNVPAMIKPALDEFPYRIWRWIYSNATKGKDLYGEDEPRGSSGFFGFFRDLFS